MPASSSKEPTLADLLAALDQLAGTEFHEVDLRVGGARLRVARGPAATVAAALPAAAAPPAPVAPVEDGSADAAASGLETVTAPMVGTFYRRPRPEAEPFVSVGDRVRKGQVLCIIEAMKLMNNIEAEHSGEIVEILPEDGSAVQFGDRLFAIRPA
ncbi:MAG: acetyl-CoA carboxylase biotin carboxyl carrier protein [Acidobacteriota bacterium]|nr:acetyl-CoA carboxylase biotin carboxyl carrier protein [Acidobacteriota bacterium]